MDGLCNLQKKINAEIARFHHMRHERINQIQSLPKHLHRKILFKRYVQYQIFEEIAAGLDYAYNYICTVHGEAVKEFERML